MVRKGKGRIFASYIVPLMKSGVKFKTYTKMSRNDLDLIRIGYFHVISTYIRLPLDNSST